MTLEQIEGKKLEAANRLQALKDLNKQIVQEANKALGEIQSLFEQTKGQYDQQLQENVAEQQRVTGRFSLLSEMAQEAKGEGQKETAQEAAAVPDASVATLTPALAPSRKKQRGGRKGIQLVNGKAEGAAV